MLAGAGCCPAGVLHLLKTRQGKEFWLCLSWAAASGGYGKWPCSWLIYKHHLFMLGQTANSLSLYEDAVRVASLFLRVIVALRLCTKGSSNKRWILHEIWKQGAILWSPITCAAVITLNMAHRHTTAVTLQLTVPGQCLRTGIVFTLCNDSYKQHNYLFFTHQMVPKADEPNTLRATLLKMMQVTYIYLLLIRTFTT